MNNKKNLLNSSNNKIPATVTFSRYAGKFGPGGNVYININTDKEIYPDGDSSSYTYIFGQDNLTLNCFVGDIIYARGSNHYGYTHAIGGGGQGLKVLSYSSISTAYKFSAIVEEAVAYSEWTSDAHGGGSN